MQKTVCKHYVHGLRRTSARIRIRLVLFSFVPAGAARTLLSVFCCTTGAAYCSAVLVIRGFSSGGTALDLVEACAVSACRSTKERGSGCYMEQYR